MLAIVLAFFGVSPRIQGGAVRPWLLVAAVVVLLLAAASPRSLAPVNRAVRFVGYAVGLVVQQVTLFVLFFLVLTPMALVARLVGRDAIGARRRGAARTHWVRRVASGRVAEDLGKPY